MLKKICNTKKTRRFTLSIAILATINYFIWRFLPFVIFATNKRGDWDFWGISTMGYDELFFWQQNDVFSIICFLSIPFHLILSIIMFVYYVKLRKNKEVSKLPYILVTVHHIALIVFSIAVKMFTVFGVFWFVLNSTILVLSISTTKKI